MTPTVEAISELLNKPDTWDCDLNKILLEIDWSSIAPDTIVPKLELRRFTKSITDTEIRLAVMKFLHEYARYYFYDSAYNYVVEEYNRNNWTPGDGDLEHDTNVYVSVFQSELATQISQIEKTGEFSGDKFSKQAKRIAELEKQVSELQAENKKLKGIVDQYENPFDYQFYIPDELQEEEFWHIMTYLQHKRLVHPKEDFDRYGMRRVACYVWKEKGHKALFGYFADRVSFELDLYKDKHVQWKIFRPAFINFKRVEKQAKDAVSAYKSWSNPQAPLPNDYQIIEEAIKYAEEQIAKKDDNKPQVKNHQVIESRA